MTPGQRLVADLDLAVAQAVALDLPGHEVSAGDGQLLVLGVAVEGDDLHPVEQRPGDGVDHVCGGDEQDLREVELHVQVVVAEAVVLGRVEHLEQRRRRIAAPVVADLVDLVEHHDRVEGAGLAQGADQPSRQGADVGAPVAADLGLVADAAQADARELAPQGAGHGLAERRLAGSGGADQGQDHPALALVHAALAAQAPDRQVLEDALLDLLQAGVVRVEDLAGLVHVQPLVGARVPGQRDHPLQVGADHPGLRAVGLALEPRELALGLHAGRLGHAGGLDALGPVVARLVVLAELPADRGQLAAQQHLALGLVEVLAHVLADALAQPRVGEPLALGVDRQAQARGDVDRLEQGELGGERDLRRVAGGVGQAPRVGDAGEEAGHLGPVAPQGGHLLDHRAVLPRQRRRLGPGVEPGPGAHGR